MTRAMAMSRLERLERDAKTGERVLKAAREAVALWGERPQLRLLTEECGECVAAVNQHERGRIGDEELALECADVFIMVAQARHILGRKFDVALEVKLARLEQRIREGAVFK